MWIATLDREDLPLPNSPIRIYLVSSEGAMKRIAFYLTISHIAFTCGVGVASFWNWYTRPPIKVSWDLPARQTLPSVPTNASTPEPPRPEVVFGEGRLRIITHEVRMESKRLHYQIEVSYPEIVGSKDRHIQNLNGQIKRLVTRQYEWTMSPSQADLRYYREKHPDLFNTIHLDYEVRLATDSLLSIYFRGESYGIGAAHAVHYSFTLNYDLTLRKKLELLPANSEAGGCTRYRRWDRQCPSRICAKLPALTRLRFCFDRANGDSLVSCVSTPGAINAA